LCPSFEKLFGKNVIKIKGVEEDLAKEIARKLNIPWESVESRFNNTIGSILLELAEMKKRWIVILNNHPEQAAILCALKKMHFYGLYKEKETFLKEWIRTICLKEEYDWKKHNLEQLQRKDFLKLAGENVLAEEAYLETIVTFAEEVTGEVELYKELIKAYQEMIEIFQEIPEALHLIGMILRAVWTRTSDLASLRLALQAYGEALKIYTLKEYPNEYALAQWDLGALFHNLILLKEKEENCLKAEKAIQNALKIFTEEAYPIFNKTLKENLLELSNLCKNSKNK